MEWRRANLVRMGIERLSNVGETLTSIKAMAHPVIFLCSLNLGLG